MEHTSVTGPYCLTLEQIAAVVTEKSPGSFVLGCLLPDGSFVPRLVGRSDSDVRRELELQTQFAPSLYAFTFSYAASPHAAFEQQCRDFHACSVCEALENKHHPTRPSHTTWLCPECGDQFLKPKQA